MARVPTAFTAALIAAGLSLLLGVAVGAVWVPPSDVVRALMDPDSPGAVVIRDLRAPRVVMALLVGGALSVAGAVLQAVVRNPLAEPWLLGVSGGAALGAVIAIVVGLPAGWTLSGFAAIGAIAAMATVYRISLVAGRRTDPRVLVLAGVVVGSFAGALSTALLVIADPFSFRAAVLWLFGGFSGVTWNVVGRFLLVLIPAVVIVGTVARGLDLLALGEEAAAALGADVERTRRLAVLAVALLTAGAVSAVGVIGFVGLVIPHATRWIVGPLHRAMLPIAFLAGGAFMVLADLVARTMMAPSELPVGVVTAVVGVPLFAALLRRSAS